MSRIVSRAESWESVYSAFQQVNFSAFDYDTIKESLLDYMKLYFPEDFNDYIESSEFIAVLELFAYISEIVSYRQDLNAHENFLSTAQRKESVLRLAKFLSYNPSRNIAARGLTKLTSITTSERVFDSNGKNLANVKITWNDTNNPDWKEQYLLVMNLVLQQEFGTIAPTERIQINDVLFELYSWNNNNIQNGVFSYSTTVSGEGIEMELVPTELEVLGPVERRPENQSKFSILYGTDGLGDASDTTGFFCLTKQGILQKTNNSFDGVTPNQTFDVTIDNINETDVWVNNVDPSTLEITDDGTSTEGRSGEWVEVDLAHAQNIVFNTNPNRNKYEIETLDNDNIRLVFGDGEFADIPKGTYEVWSRTSLNRDIVIPQNTVTNQASSFTYQDNSGNLQTLSFTFSLINTLQNASPSEDIEHIRKVAPSVYYSQDRMVNGRDYNTFMLQDSTILKLRSINRTYAGDSKYIDWHDPSETYDNVKLFGDDLLLYFKEGTTAVNVLNVSSPSAIVNNYIEPLLSSTDFFTIFASLGVPPASIRREFTVAEKAAIVVELTNIALSAPQTVQLFYSIDTDDWEVLLDPAVSTLTNPLWDINEGMITVTANTSSSWTVTHRTQRLVAESQTTRFWNTNNGDRVVDFDTLNTTGDKIIVLKANENDKHDSILTRNWTFDILGQELIDEGVDAGLIDISKLSVLPVDTNEDGIPDDMELDEILDPTYVVTADGVVTNLPSIATYQDITLTGNVDNSFTFVTRFEGGVVGPTATDLVDEVEIVAINTAVSVTIDVKNYVYFNRTTNIDPWVHVQDNEENILNWTTDPVSPNNLYKREHGRDDLNFAWFHETTRFNLIDPSSTNINDIFVVPRGYFTSIRRWLDNKTNLVPIAPTPLQLRTDYANLLDNKMISDTVVLHPGKFKILFGQHATPQLQAIFKVIRSSNGRLVDNQVKVNIVNTIKTFFDINKWEFGETFYFTELVADIHKSLGSEINSVVLVPTSTSNQFGDIFQVFAREDEIFQPSISVDDIEIVESLNSDIIRQNSN